MTLTENAISHEIVELNDNEIDAVAGGPVFVVAALLAKAGKKTIAAAIIADAAAISVAGYAVGNS